MTIKQSLALDSLECVANYAASVLGRPTDNPEQYLNHMEHYLKKAKAGLE